MAFEFLELSKRAIDNLNPVEREALEQLSKNKNIIISKVDKGNAVVIQNVSDYRAKISQILNATDKFKKLNDDPTVKRERSLYNMLSALWKRMKLDPETLERIRPCGSRAGVMYGLPMVHKDNEPIRPIISAIGTYSYRLAKYLDEILKPLASNNNRMLHDTFDFVNKVSKLNITRDSYLTSLDVESLFTNIPTSETIEIILNRAFNKKNNTTDLYFG